MYWTIMLLLFAIRCFVLHSVLLSCFYCFVSPSCLHVHQWENIIERKSSKIERERVSKWEGEQVLLQRTSFEGGKKVQSCSEAHWTTPYASARDIFNFYIFIFLFQIKHSHTKERFGTPFTPFFWSFIFLLNKLWQKWIKKTNRK